MKYISILSTKDRDTTILKPTLLRQSQILLRLLRTTAATAYFSAKMILL
jgi:hypothetical protein